MCDTKKKKRIRKEKKTKICKEKVGKKSILLCKVICFHFIFYQNIYQTRRLVECMSEEEENVEKEEEEVVRPCM